MPDFRDMLWVLDRSFKKKLLLRNLIAVLFDTGSNCADKGYVWTCIVDLFVDLPKMDVARQLTNKHNLDTNTSIAFFLIVQT